MESNSSELSRGPRHGGVSRRGLLATGAVLLGSQSAPMPAYQGGIAGTRLAYVGCYTPNGLGIYLFRVETNGDLTQLQVFTTPNPSPYSVSATSPSWLALDPAKNFLYAGNEIGNFAGGTTGAISAFKINKTNGELTFLNSVSSGGNGPAHHSVDPSGKFVLVANYGGGNVSVIPILGDGSLGPPTDVQQDVTTCTPAPCTMGPNNAAKAPPGSFARSGHDRPHAHMIQTDPSGNFAISTDLGLDITIVWQFDRIEGRLLSPKTFPTSVGAGPRHFAFHPNGRWFYLLNEESSTLAFMNYDARNGSLSSPVSEISTLPKTFVGTNFTSELMVSPNGNFIYAANRLHDTIAIFTIDGSGRPELVGEEWTRGDYPRSFNIDPSGSFMYVCNQRSDAIVTFRIDGGGRNLTFRDQYTPVGNPAIIVFL